MWHGLMMNGPQLSLCSSSPPPFRILLGRSSLDVFVREPMPFVELARDAVVKKIDGMDVRVASIEHLIAMKRISSRARDLEDIEKLTAIQAMENKDESQ